MSADPQKDALAKAEREFCLKRKGEANYAGRLTHTETKTLICEVRRLYSLPPVRLKTTRYNDTDAEAWCETDSEDGAVVRATITVDVSHRPLNAMTILHELAHVVADVHFPKAKEAHGREFVGIVSWLYDYFKVAPSDAFGLVLRWHDVKRRRVGLCAPELMPKHL